MPDMLTGVFGWRRPKGIIFYSSAHTYEASRFRGHSNLTFLLRTLKSRMADGHGSVKDSGKDNLAQHSAKSFYAHQERDREPLIRVPMQ